MALTEKPLISSSDLPWERQTNTNWSEAFSVLDVRPCGACVLFYICVAFTRLAAMDPVTAIGLASAILTFVDFSWSLVRGADEIYRSPTGTSKENASVNTIIADLKEVTDGIDTDIQGHGKHEKALAALAKECEGLSKDLLQVLGKIRKKDGSKRATLKAALRSMTKEKEIVSIEKRLGEYRAEIVLRLNMMLW